MATNLAATLNVIIVYFTYFLVSVRVCPIDFLAIILRPIFFPIVWRLKCFVAYDSRAIMLKMAKCHCKHNKFCAIKRVDLCTALE